MHFLNWLCRRRCGDFRQRLRLLLCWGRFLLHPRCGRFRYWGMRLSGGERLAVRAGQRDSLIRRRRCQPSETSQTREHAKLGWRPGV
jgi:hypothetical protein